MEWYLLTGIAGNALVIPPDWKKIQKSISELPKKNRIVLLPETGMALLEHIEAESVVSYGLSDRCSLTFSSIGDTEALVSVQRELLTIDGGTVEPQEIPVARRSCSKPEKMLVDAGALLISGVPPEDITEL